MRMKQKYWQQCLSIVRIYKAKKPVKIGNVQVIALFKYKGFPIGEPFKKELRIYFSEDVVGSNEGTGGWCETS